MAILRRSWGRLEAILGLLGTSWGDLGDVLGRLGGVLGASWAPSPNKSEGNPLLEAVWGSVLEGSWRVLGTPGDVLERIFALLGASWACLNKKLKKDSIFDISKTVFLQF